jgi:hypothetical protein
LGSPPSVLEVVAMPDPDPGLRGSPRYYNYRRWKVLLTTSGFMLVASLVSLWLGLRVLASLCMIGLSTSTFVAGYLYRASVAAEHRVPWIRTFWLDDDDWTRDTAA